MRRVVSAEEVLLENGTAVVLPVLVITAAYALDWPKSDRAQVRVAGRRDACLESEEAMRTMAGVLSKTRSELAKWDKWQLAGSRSRLRLLIVPPTVGIRVTEIRTFQKDLTIPVARRSANERTAGC